MNFTNVPEQIDKDFIFSRLTEEDIFGFYGIPVQRGKFCSPLRRDRRPTCNFYRSRNNQLIYRDWGTNHRFDAIGLVQWKFNLSFGQALIRIWADMLVSGNPSLPASYGKTEYISKKEPARIRVKRRPWTMDDAQWWQIHGISLNTLRFYNVSPIERAWLNGEPFYVNNPKDVCYAYHFGFEEYKLYFPMRDEFRFISSSSAIQGWHQLPPTGRWVVITKSLKDVMLLHEYSIAAIALHSEALVPSDDLLEKLKERFEYAVLFYDNDRQGITAMQQAKSKMPCIWIPRKAGSPKDITDYRAAYGYVKTLDLIKYAENKLEKWIKEQS